MIKLAFATFLLVFLRAWQHRNKSPDNCPDGPRYKAVGNSKAVPVIQWVGWRVLNELKRMGH